MAHMGCDVFSTEKLHPGFIKRSQLFSGVYKELWLERNSFSKVAIIFLQNAYYWAIVNAVGELWCIRSRDNCFHLSEIYSESLLVHPV